MLRHLPTLVLVAVAFAAAEPCTAPCDFPQDCGLHEWCNPQTKCCEVGALRCDPACPTGWRCISYGLCVPETKMRQSQLEPAQEAWQSCGNRCHFQFANMVRRTTALVLGCLAGFAMADDPICAVNECTVITTGKLCNRLAENCPTCLSQLMGGKTARCTNATFDGCQGGTVCASVTTLPPTPTTSTAPPNATTPVVTRVDTDFNLAQDDGASVIGNDTLLHWASKKRWTE
ncbi:hypothetical protein SDRG_11450 [Saprolegnia diclina VS20]|uniref:Granulins domain-containing protein n=1 Tax=Saprolegnia diclina (strain VS20) TaxID=1156394 RepID=T0RM24_SAPDV|nr:hypothetical protein SDRG_11450 [Saprolegnia diclina VS20]EQC30977.1 hypothetical protein SDRG_11450 [Saprolegnia diclina VS20]|eukprot:XP_008615715.1 hypothetical protein SDRG_11450 [Saprolegnia diclina VS20]